MVYNWIGYYGEATKDMIVSLSPADINKVKANLSVYKWAGEATHIPWQMIAAVHYRERNLNIDSNPFQFDPKLSHDQIFDLLMHYSSLHETEVVSLANAGVDDFKAAAVCAGAFLVRKSLKRLDIQHASDDIVKDSFYGYNGRVFGSADKSPYVMNGYDKSHFPMRLVGTEPDPHDPTKRIHINIEDRRPGAFVVFKQLQSLKL